MAGSQINCTDLDASELSVAIASRTVSCEEVMRDHLERIEQLNPTFNAIVSLRDNSALLDEAREADKALARGEYRGWLHGIPFAVKDLADVAGVRTSHGSPLFGEEAADQDCLMAHRIRQAGAIFIGKTNTPEFGLGSHTYNPVFGATGNAYDPSLSAGGSSGGASVALALRMVPVADGSDMMGSLRNPAGWNNIWGLRPSFGRVPDLPSNDLFLHQLASLGPMGRSVTDLGRLLDTIAGHAVGAPLSLSLPTQAASFVPLLDVDITGLRVGWIGSWGGYYPTEPGILELSKAALDHVAGQEAEVEDLCPDFDPNRLWCCWRTLRHWSLSGGLGALHADPDKRGRLKPEARWEIEEGLNLSAADVYAAGVTRSDWVRWLNTAFERYDILALPTAQVFAFDVKMDWPKEISGHAMDTYHRWMEVVIPGSLSGNPVIAMPAGFDQKGRSIGLQLIGPPRSDARLLEIARAFERRAHWIARRPDALDRSRLPEG